jgi:hypothetical protein
MRHHTHAPHFRTVVRVPHRYLAWLSRKSAARHQHRAIPIATHVECLDGLTGLKGPDALATPPVPNDATAVGGCSHELAAAQIGDGAHAICVLADHSQR